MTLEERIHDRVIIYEVRQDKTIALEIAWLHLEVAKRKNCKIKITEACLLAISWLKVAGEELPEYVEKLSCYGQLEELNKILAKAKATTA